MREAAKHEQMNHAIACSKSRHFSAAVVARWRVGEPVVRGVHYDRCGGRV